MQAITLNLDTNLSPIDLEAYKQQLMVAAQKLLRKFEKKKEPKFSDFYGTLTHIAPPEKSYEEIREEIMKERYGI